MVSEIQGDFQNCHIFVHETWTLEKVAEVAHLLTRSCTYTLFLAQRVEIELISPSGFPEIQADFQNYHIWA